EARWLVVSDHFLDDFRVGWDLALPGGSQTDGRANARAAIIDEWTLKMLMEAAAADSRMVTYTAPVTKVAERQTMTVRRTPADRNLVVRGTLPLKEPPETFRPSLELVPTVSQ